MKEFKNLYETALDRKANPREGSYTNYLFNEGLEKILKKVGEESTEVIIASMKRDKEELVQELGDLFYHIGVLLVETGLSPDDINAELERRSHKTGNLKEERKAIEKL